MTHKLALLLDDLARKHVAELYMHNDSVAYSTALMQCHTRTTFFLDSTGLLERSTFVILEKIARVANNSWSRSFHEYRLLDRLRLAMANRVAMEATLSFY